MSEAIKRIYDGFVALDGGVDSNKSPAVRSKINPNGLHRNQVSFAWNATMRGSQITQRPAYVQRVLNFAGNAALQTAFETGTWQQAHFYDSQGGFNSFVASIGGRLFQIEVENGFRVLDVSIPGDLNPANRNYSWFVQAENFLVNQNGSNIPIIFDGAKSRRALPDEIKTGTVMAYSQGRIGYATGNGYSFRFTDLVGGPSGTATYQFKDAVLKETENTFLNEGGDFAVPGNSGGIRAMIVPMNLNTSLGQGPLQVFTVKGAFSVNTPIDRTTWKDVTSPIQTVSQNEYGALGANSTITVNGDVFYRSTDGVRSFILAYREWEQWTNTPISREMRRIIESDSEPLLFYGSAVVFQNRMLMTALPVYTDKGVYHRGLMAMDFDLVSTFKSASPPAWEGFWSGLNILQIVKGTFGEFERCFLFVLSKDNTIELWEIRTDELFDNFSTRIQWIFETPAYDFERPFSLKRLDTGAIWAQDIVGKVDFDTKYRPDQHPCWVDWQTWSRCAKVTQCPDDLTGPCPTIKNLTPQYRPKMKLSQPDDTINDDTGGLYRDLFEAQVRVQVTGPCKIKQTRLTAVDRPEAPFGENLEDEDCTEIECCNAAPLDYRADGG